jgi:hypothetical protein
VARPPVFPGKKRPAVNTAQKYRSATGDDDARLAELIADVLETEAGIVPARTKPSETTDPKQVYSNPADRAAAAELSGSKQPEGTRVKSIQIVNDGSPPSMQIARNFLSPVSLNTITAETFIDHTTLDLNAAIKVVRERAEKVVKGDTSEMETTLVGNIAALDAIFGTMAVYAQAHLKANKLPQFEMLMRVAFRAQSQLRTSIDSLAELKNPKPIFAKTLNVANGNQQVNSTTGPQQVNNGPAPNDAPRAENQEPVSTNKLLETT